MEIPKDIKRVEIFYDGRCGMCCTFAEWLEKQRKVCEVEMVAYQSDRAMELFPEIEDLKPDTEMVLRCDGEQVFRGGEAWVICLHSCLKYQDVAKRLANPTMTGLAQKVGRLIAANRYGISRLFFGKKDKHVKEQLHELKDPEDCDGECNLDQR